MNQYKLLFLDIDGVLNTFQGELYHALNGSHSDQNYPGKFDHESRPHDFYQFLSQCWSVEAVANLTWLLRSVPELKIVVSSVWRHGHTDDNMRWLFIHYPEIFERVIGRTPAIMTGIRGREIQMYLDKHNFTGDFVIIDDDRDMEHLTPKLVLTNGYHGFTFQNMEKALKILNVDRNAFSNVWRETLREK